VAATQAAQTAAGATTTYGYAPQQAYAPYAQTTSNRYALITFAVAALYVFIALESRIVIFGILPLGLSLRSKRAGEPLAGFAIAAAAVAIVVAAA
jgi:hypothetical protein